MSVPFDPKNIAQAQALYEPSPATLIAEEQMVISGKLVSKKTYLMEATVMEKAKALFDVIRSGGENVEAANIVRTGYKELVVFVAPAKPAPQSDAKTHDAKGQK